MSFFLIVYAFISIVSMWIIWFLLMSGSLFNIDYIENKNEVTYSTLISCGFYTLLLINGYLGKKAIAKNLNEL
jgi:short subunit fatty acids transporter